MKAVNRLCAFLFLLSACMSRAFAAPTARYVSLNGGNVSPYDSWAKAGTSVKTVVDYANTQNQGDTVWVSNGLHTLTGNLTVKNTFVKSYSANVTETILNGAGSYNVQLNHTNAWVERITMSNGWHWAWGGGFQLQVGTVTNCVARHCRSAITGGGVTLMNDGTGYVLNCTFANNTAVLNGGGVCVGYPRKGAIRNCTIVSNTAKDGGGVYYYQNYPDVHIPMENCDIAYNVATNMSSGGLEGGGGGVWVQDSSPVVANCRIHHNTAFETGGGIFVYHATTQPWPVFRNCLISNNVARCASRNNVFVNGNGQGGGGVFAAGGSFSGCTLAGNVSSNTGGGIHFYMWNSVMTNCVMRGNTAGKGGGGHVLYISNAGRYVELYNCLIAGNTATDTGGGFPTIPGARHTGASGSTTAPSPPTRRWGRAAQGAFTRTAPRPPATSRTPSPI